MKYKSLSLGATTTVESRGVTVMVKQTTLEKQRVSHRGVHVWGVNSLVTKHSDYFV